MTTEPSTALERPAVGPAPAIMNSAEMEQTWRVAKALAASGFFKDAQQAEQAFGKILLGRDMGLAPMEAMLAIHLIEGKAEMSADFHATRVKLTPGYDYDVEWTGEVDTDTQGCSITFLVPYKGEPYVRERISDFTIKDAKRAGLYDRKGPKGGDGNWKKFPRNMLFARAMSNGVAWFCPEVMGAVRIYTPGEVEAELAPIGGDAVDVPIDTLSDLPLADSVMATVRRAEKLGHAGHSNVGTVDMLLRDQPEEKVREWLGRVNDELDGLAVPDAGVLPSEERATGVCLDPDPSRAGVVCQIAAGHEGPHMGAGQTWDSFLHQPATMDPAPEDSSDDLRAQAAQLREDAEGAEHADNLLAEAEQLEERAEQIEAGQLVINGGE